jgi:1-phosphatidylinositol phosphodiesterase
LSRSRVAVRGRLSQQPHGAFGRLVADFHEREISLSGRFADRAQLHGLLVRLPDLGVSSSASTRSTEGRGNTRKEKAKVLKIRLFGGRSEAAARVARSPAEDVDVGSGPTRGGGGMRLRLRFAVSPAVATWLALAAALLLGNWTAAVASAHSSPGYSHDSSTGATHTDWMAGLPSALRVSELSLPGTHDSGASVIGGDIVFTQSMDIGTQLDAGIRVLDIRLKISGNELKVYHGISGQGLEFDGDVLAKVTSFLAAHPGETVLMRIKDEGAPEDGFDTRVIDTLNKYSTFVYQGASDNPTLGEIRGKIVVLQNFESAMDLGIPWTSLGIQDDYKMGSNWDLAKKWGEVKDQFISADDVADSQTIHVNFTSAANGGFPYFFASGHSSPQTGAPRLLTGLTRGIIDTCSDWPDTCIDEYPSVNCFLGTCSVAFEGVNIMAMDYLNDGKVRHAGIVMSDFPGDGLIDAIIDLNPWNSLPVANAGGPYVGDEGSLITFTAAGSSDPDGDTLSYRWDFDNDGIWDTSWSSSPSASHTWADDFMGVVAVEVSDGHQSTSKAFAQVTVQNVAPVVSITHLTDETATEVGTGTRLVLTSVPIGLHGSFTDAGTVDGHAASITWGDGTTDDLGAVTGAVSGAHSYAHPGTYTVTMRVTDDDGGVGIAARPVTVVDAHGALDSAVQTLSALESTPGLSTAATHALDKTLSELAGGNDGGASNGAITLLDNGNRNAALGAIIRAIQDIQQYEAVTGKDLSDIKSLLTLTAKSIAVDAVKQADAAASNNSQDNAVASASTLIAKGDSLLAAQSYVESVGTYQEAVHVVQGII